MIALLLLLSSCSYFTKTHVEAAPQAADINALQSTHTVDLASLKAAADPENGWPASSECDGMIWAGEAAAGGAPVNLDAGEPSPGQTVRSPKNPCTPTSRDMVYGYAYGRWSVGNAAALQRLANYGEAHNWIMSSNVEISTIDAVVRGLIARAIDKLTGGADSRPYKNATFVCIPAKKDFIQLMQVLLVNFASEVDGGVSQECIDIVKEFYKEHQDDALFGGTVGLYTGDFSHPITLLSGSYACPSYVRGAPDYCLVHKVWAENVILKHYNAKLLAPHK